MYFLALCGFYISYFFRKLKTNYRKPHIWLQTKAVSCLITITYFVIAYPWVFNYITFVSFTKSKNVQKILRKLAP